MRPRRCPMHFQSSRSGNALSRGPRVKALCQDNAFGSCDKQILKDGSEGTWSPCHGMPQDHGVPARLRCAVSNAVFGHFTHTCGSPRSPPPPRDEGRNMV